MNLVQRLFVTLGARRDARLHLASPEERITAELGPRPDAATDPAHAEFVHVLADRARVEELREDVSRAEDALSDHLPPVLYTFGLVLAVAIETLGAVLVLESLGFPANERLPLGAGLALALIGATAVVARRTAAGGGGKPPPGSLGARVADAVKRSLGTTVALFAYSLMVGALATVRVLDAGGDADSSFSVIANAILMVGTAVAPAWAVEALVRKRAPARAVRDHLKRLRKRLREAERAHERAQEGVNRFARELARWDNEAARRRALYQTHHRLETARNDESTTEKGPARQRTRARPEHNDQWFHEPD